MFAELLNRFSSSQHGQQAAALLAQQGWSPAQQQQIFGAALPAAANALHMQTQGSSQPALSLFNIFGGHPGRQFLLGAVAGLFRGDGVVGSVGDGAMGMVSGHMAEVLAQRLGMSPQLAGNVTAALTPMITHFVYENLLSHPDVMQQHGAHPGVAAAAIGGGGVGAMLAGLMGGGDANKVAGDVGFGWKPDASPNFGGGGYNDPSGKKGW
jgi:hypothetical protein